MLKIKEEINGISVDVNFNAGINCIDLGMSGTGKTFLMTIVKAYCIKNSIPCKAFDYNDTDKDIISVLQNLEDINSIVIFDNADLYMTDELSSVIDGYNNVIFIISLKKRLKIKSHYRLNKLIYEDNCMVCKEV